MISAQWKQFTSTGAGEWTIMGSKAGKLSFEARARRAATGIADTNTSDLLTAWLDQLKKEGFGFKPMMSAITKNPDGSEQAKLQMGHIAGLCSASANFCKALESRALQLEFEHKKHGQESVKALVHRQFETMKRTMQLRSARKEQTPEAPESNAVAQQSTAKPSKADLVHPQNSSSPKKDRKVLIDQFIAKVLDSTGRKITRTEIWTAAGYLDATEFQRFQRHDKRTTRSSVSNFSRVLNMEPEAFLKVLDRKQEAK
jgi:hypothetical protein